MRKSEIENLEMSLSDIKILASAIEKGMSYVKPSDIIRKSGDALRYLEYLKDKKAFKEKYSYGEEGIML